MGGSSGPCGVEARCGLGVPRVGILGLRGSPEPRRPDVPRFESAHEPWGFRLTFPAHDRSAEGSPGSRARGLFLRPGTPPPPQTVAWLSRSAARPPRAPVWAEQPLVSMFKNRIEMLRTGLRCRAGKTWGRAGGGPLQAAGQAEPGSQPLRRGPSVPGEHHTRRRQKT